jgi:AraC-like DNA-binding protein
MKTTLGLTPSRWILDAHLKRAAQLLESTGFSVSDIALKSGFDNLSHFHRCFRCAFKLTPLRFRKKRFIEIL